MPKVWIIKEQVKRMPGGGIEAMDYTPAMKWGELHFITDTDIPHYPGSSVAKEWTKKINKFVEQYDEQNDFIVCTGQPVAMVQIGFLMGKQLVAPRYLVFRREDNAYQPLLINS